MTVGIVAVFVYRIALPEKVNRVGDFGNHIAVFSLINRVGVELGDFLVFQIVFAVPNHDVCLFLGADSRAVRFEVIDRRQVGFRFNFHRVDAVIVAVRAVGHEFVIAVHVPALTVLVVEYAKHETGNVGKLIDISFVLGNGVEARLEDTVLRQEGDIAFHDFDVEIGDAVVNAVSTRRNPIAHSQMRSRNTVHQRDAARIDLISSELIFGDGNVHVV